MQGRRNFALDDVTKGGACSIVVVQTTKVLLLIIFADIDPIADSSSKTKELKST